MNKEQIHPKPHFNGSNGAKNHHEREKTQEHDQIIKFNVQKLL